MLLYASVFHVASSPIDWYLIARPSTHTHTHTHQCLLSPESMHSSGLPGHQAIGRVCVLCLISFCA
jgi:hypothetical protein